MMFFQKDANLSLHCAEFFTTDQHIDLVFIDLASSG